MTRDRFGHNENDALLRNGGTIKRATSPRNLGRLPSIVLINPKFPHNVGGAIRMASCYGIEQVWYTGTRVDLMGADVRIPREERMRAYDEVTLVNYERPFDQFQSATPVAVELRENAESLVSFQHPRDALYVFGPEDGDLGRVALQHCHRFVVIPTKHCLNLSSAIATVLYDRQSKLG